MRETQVRFLGREDPLEKEMAIHSSTLAWKISWTEEPDRLQSMGSQRVGHNWATSLSILRNVEEKKVYPFFLLENSRPLSPWRPLDFLSTCRGNESLLSGFSQGREAWCMVELKKKKKKWSAKGCGHIAYRPVKPCYYTPMTLPFEPVSWHNSGTVELWEIRHTVLIAQPSWLHSQ